MNAESMEKKITAFADLAQKRAGGQDENVESVVRSLTHESYLLKHNTKDVLNELQQLVETYPDEFYDGDANDHVMQHISEMGSVDFWYAYPGAALAAGLEWAILEELRTRQEPA
ncbi:hypothetical protein [Halalkalicoccus subterraneus]|uniref:hypothetical protein n=1 Tax=Halalkalicoccus subterraneus TaxID=2675002 RepID=UPI000EFBB6B4|nr:hypothetical protein [Halalkalicoccus subterraneus]